MYTVLGVNAAGLMLERMFVVYKISILSNASDSFVTSICTKLKSAENNTI